MLEAPKGATQLDPTPIPVDAFWKSYNKAIEADDKTFAALTLTALNCAMYGGEVGSFLELGRKLGGGADAVADGGEVARTAAVDHQPRQRAGEVGRGF